MSIAKPSIVGKKMGIFAFRSGGVGRMLLSVGVAGTPTASSGRVQIAWDHNDTINWHGRWHVVVLRVVVHTRNEQRERIFQTVRGKLGIGIVRIN